MLQTIHRVEEVFYSGKQKCKFIEDTSLQCHYAFLFAAAEYHLYSLVNYKFIYVYVSLCLLIRVFVPLTISSACN